jgi:hypothetical protein
VCIRLLGVALHMCTLMQSFIEAKNPDIPFKSSKTEQFYDLGLEVKNCPTLLKAFEQYCEVEELTGDNQVEHARVCVCMYMCECMYACMMYECVYMYACTYVCTSFLSFFLSFFRSSYSRIVCDPPER